MREKGLRMGKLIMKLKDKNILFYLMVVVVFNISCSSTKVNYIYSSKHYNLYLNQNFTYYLHSYGLSGDNYSYGRYVKCDGKLRLQSRYRPIKSKVSFVESKNDNFEINVFDKKKVAIFDNQLDYIINDSLYDNYDSFKGGKINNIVIIDNVYGVFSEKIEVLDTNNKLFEITFDLSYSNLVRASPGYIFITDYFFDDDSLKLNKTLPFDWQKIYYPIENLTLNNENRKLKKKNLFYLSKAEMKYIFKLKFREIWQSTNYFYNNNPNGYTPQIPQ